MSPRKSLLPAVVLSLALAAPFAPAQEATPDVAQEAAPADDARQAPPAPETAPAAQGPASAEDDAGEGGPVADDVGENAVDEATEEIAEEATEEAADQAPVEAPGEEGAVVAASSDPDAASASSKVPLAEIRRYVGLFNAIRQGYVDPVDDRELMDSAIRGLLLDLDPHSAYLEKRAAQAFDESATGAYDGIGVEVLQLPDGKVRVIAPIDGTPAAKAGIRAGDTIVAVDGKPLRPADADGPGPLRGPPGTRAVLSVLREGEGAPLEIVVHRETIRIASVRGRLLEPGYAYLRISAFQVETADNFRDTLAELHEEAGGALKGLVIDLRSNPGGLLTSAVRVADDLLETGRIVSTRGRNPVNDTEFSATPGDLMHGAPVAVVVDAGSASASEVLAGALHDNGRARIVGSRTFGKGSVQTVMPLDNGDAVKLTTARYYTPSGRSIQARGIDPDVVLEPDNRGPTLASTTPGYAEATLPGHLRGDEEDGSATGHVLDGDGPIEAALAELKKMSTAAKTALAAGKDGVAAPAPAAARE